MTDTRGDMKDEILDDMERSSTTDGTRTLTAISAAIRFYQPKRFFFNESRSVTFDTVATQSSYLWTDIGTEFYRIDGAYVTRDTTVTELCPRNYTDFETPIVSDGLPTDYAVIKSSVVLWIPPDDIYSVRLVGHIKAAEPANDTEEDNVWFTEANELIKCRAKAYLYAHIYENPQMAQIMRLAEQDALSALCSATTDKVSTGTLMPSPM